MTIPSFLRACRSLSLFGSALLVLSCSSPAPTPQRASAASIGSVGAVRAPLPGRAEAVASADAWAVLGSKQPGPTGADRTLDAAALRERIFRLEHRETDALEAIELYRQAAAQAPARRCAALISAALLEGELRASPEQSFRGVYQAELESGGDPTCKARAQTILNTLGAYRPLPTVLAELENEPRIARPSPPASAGSVASPRATDEPISPQLSTSRGPARVTKVEHYGAADAARVVVSLSEASAYQVGVLNASSPSPRLFVDIEASNYHGPSSFEVGGLVARVRVGASAKRTRVVLDLTASAYRHVFYMPEPFRLVIDVSKHAPARAEEPNHGARSVHRVVLDPGHGGHDPGASGPSGLREKDVTLDIAHRAAPLIARELGIATLLTRDGDEYVALEERTARANSFQADLFVSIHCNASEDGAGRGVMTFVLDDSRDAASTRLAARENDASAEAASELVKALGLADGGFHSARSNHFAELLQRSAIASLSPSYGDIPNAGIKRAGFYVLAGARMPAVLFETSFISSSVGETRFNSGDFRQKIADAIVNAIHAYKEGL